MKSVYSTCIWFFTLQSFWLLVFSWKVAHQQANFVGRKIVVHIRFVPANLWIKVLQLSQLSYFCWYGERDLTFINHRGGTLPWLCYSVTPDCVILLWRISMGNRVRYVLMLVFPIPSKSLKNEIVVAVGECMEHLLTPKLRPKALPIFHRPHEVQLKVTFSNKIGNISLFHFHMELACKPRWP